MTEADAIYVLWLIMATASRCPAQAVQQAGPKPQPAAGAAAAAAREATGCETGSAISHPAAGKHGHGLDQRGAAAAPSAMTPCRARPGGGLLAKACAAAAAEERCVLRLAERCAGLLETEW